MVKPLFFFYIVVLLFTGFQNLVASESLNERLYNAAKRGNTLTVKEILNANPESWLWDNVFGSFVNTRKSDSHGWSALHTAAFHGHHEVVSALLTHKAVSVNQVDDNGWTPLLVACRAGHLEVVKVLLKDGRIDVNIPNNLGSTPLWEASRHNHPKVIEWIIASGREIDFEKKGRFEKGDKETSSFDAVKKSGTEDAVWLMERFSGDSKQTRQEVRDTFPVFEVTLLKSATAFWEKTNKDGKEKIFEQQRIKREKEEGPRLTIKKKERLEKERLELVRLGVISAALCFFFVLLWRSRHFFRSRPIPRVGHAVHAVHAVPPRPPPNPVVETVSEGGCPICTEDNRVLLDVNTTCGHRFCLECIQHHINAGLDERGIQFHCLSCPEMVSASVASFVLTPQGIERLHRFSTTETPSTAMPGSSSSTATVDAASLSLIEKTTKRCPRSACSAPIEKNNGCDHMTCLACKHEFCWLCFADWKSIRTTGHNKTCLNYRR